MANRTVCESMNIKLYFMYQFRKTQYISQCALRKFGVGSKIRDIEILSGILEFATPDIDCILRHPISARFSGY